MPVSVTMPRLGESVSEGTVTRWLKKEGERVEADEPLLEVSTDKVDTEIPSPASGVVVSIKVQEDETVEVGVELAVIDDGSGAAAQAPVEPPSADASAPAAAPSPPPSPPTPEAVAPPAVPVPAAPVAAVPAAVPVLAVPAAAAEAPSPAPLAAPDPIPSAPVPAPPAAAVPTTEVPAPSTLAPAASSAPLAGPANGDAAYVTPLVRKLAAEHAIDLGSVQGTGVGGRIRKQDVLDAAGQSEGAEPASTPATPAPVAPVAPVAMPVSAPVSTSAVSVAAALQVAAPAAAPASVRSRTEPLSRLRKVIAQRMVESLQVAAQLTTVLEVDVTAIAKLRNVAKADFEAREGAKLSFLPFFAVAAVAALKMHPTVNASVDLSAGTVTYHEDVHLGIAVDTERGLLVPVIHGAGDLNLGGFARKVGDLAERTRTNKVTPDELGGGTFTLTNTGSRGALFDTPIINQPQVGILGTGAVVKRPVVVQDPSLGEVVAVRSMVYLALTYDHRIVDGADAARFLVTMKERLEEADFAGELGL